MEDLRRIQNPVTPPQPVGQGSRNQPGKRRKDEFRNLLEQESGEEPAREESTDGAPSDADEERTEQSEKDPGRGLLIDERA
jgi:hypothetical protein